jgi:hypothetical protein
MKYLYTLVAAAAVVALTVYARANCGQCGPKDAAAAKTAAGTCDATKGAAGSCSVAGSCDATKCPVEACSATGCDSSEGCPIAAALERLPKLTYAVGENKTGCPKTAAKLAEESGGHVHYCVGGKEFDSKAEAQAALLTATDKFVAAATEPHTCPASGQVTLAGRVQGCTGTAAHTADRMRQAMAGVKLTYVVGDKKCGCPVEAGKLAKESGNEVQFVVGDQKTTCETTAKLNLARARYKAAVGAMVRARADAEKEEPATGT